MKRGDLRNRLSDGMSVVSAGSPELKDYRRKRASDTEKSSTQAMPEATVVRRDVGRACDQMSMSERTKNIV